MVTLDGVTFEAAKIVLKYFYSGKIEFSRKIVPEILIVAEYFHLDR